MSDEPPAKQEAAPEAKKPEANQGDENGKKKKAKAPAGYEDAAEAVGGKLERNFAAAELEVEAMSAEDLAVVGEDFAKILAAKVGAEVVSVEKQFLPQFTRLMTAELSFVNRACDLNLEQRKKINAASDTCLRVAVRKYAMAQRGIMLGRAGRVQPTIPDPTVLLHQSLAKVLETTLQPEQQTAYDGEIAKRTAFRQRVAIENIVGILDERLFLSIDQRQQLTDSLDKNWDPNWIQSMEMLINGNQYLPLISDQAVVPALNETQKQVWRTIQKRSYMTFGLVNWGEQAAVLDDFPLDAAEAVAE